MPLFSLFTTNASSTSMTLPQTSWSFVGAILVGVGGLPLNTNVPLKSPHSWAEPTSDQARAAKTEKTTARIPCHLMTKTPSKTDFSLNRLTTQLPAQLPPQAVQAVPGPQSSCFAVHIGRNS